MTKNEKLKEALRNAILDTSRVGKTVVDYDEVGSTFEVDWLEKVKEWARLCDLDLETQDPFPYQ